MVKLENEILQDNFRIETAEGEVKTVVLYYKLLRIFCRKDSRDENPVPFSLIMLVIHNIVEFYGLKNRNEIEKSIDKVCQIKEMQFDELSVELKDKVCGYLQYNQNHSIVVYQ